jgi:ribonucleotide reductase alpha subunit
MPADKVIFSMGDNMGEPVLNALLWADSVVSEDRTNMTTESNRNTPTIRVLIPVGKSISTYEQNEIRIIEADLEGYDSSVIEEIKQGVMQKGTVHRGSFLQYIDL